MDTRWKTISKKLRALWRETGLNETGRFLAAVLLVFAALAFLLNLQMEMYVTVTALFVGGICNLFLAGAVRLVLPTILDRRSSWEKIDLVGSAAMAQGAPGTGQIQWEKRDFYGIWREQWRQLHRTMLVVFGILLFLAAWWFWMRLTEYNYYYYSYNYAANYVLVGTVLIQYIHAQSLIRRHMLDCLENYMQRQKEIDQARMDAALKEALEIERRSMEQVSRSDQLRMDLITNVSHDLKTPLTSMVGYVELLKKEELGDTARDYLEVISRRAQKLKEMIESLFSLAKVSSGNVELRREKITMNRMIEQIFADMDDKIRQSELEFVQILSREDTHLTTDSGYMYRICQNLLENALKYSARGTRVFVKTFVVPGEKKNAAQESREQKVGLEVTNTAGYRMDFTKEDIVERFARADAARTSEGNGLGLAIVSTYAKALGGEFDIFIDCDQFKARLLFGRGEDIGAQVPDMSTEPDA